MTFFAVAGVVIFFIIAVVVFLIGISIFYGSAIFDDRAGMIVGLVVVGVSFLIGFLTWKFSPFEITLRAVT